MRILHLVSSISPASGGPSEAIRMLVEHAPAGYTAEIVTLDDPDEAFLRELPCPVHALGTPGGQRWFGQGLVRWLRTNRDRFDGAVVHGLWQGTGLAALLTLSGRLPYVVFAHGMLDPYFKRAFPRKHLKKWIYWLLAEFWVLRGAAHVLFTTGAEAALARQSFFLHRWQPMVMPLGTVPPTCDRLEAKLAFEDCLPALQQERFLLFLGRLDPKKGCDLLLEAFAQVAPAHPELHLLMAGPDAADWTPKLQGIVEHAGLTRRVHWPGMLRGPAKWGAFAACEAFVLPSHQENFGIAAVEALACGKPALLAHPVNLAAELEQAGCALAEDDTVAGTRRLLERWLALPVAEQAAMRRRALATFEQCYDMRRNAVDILHIFERLARKRSAHPSTATAHVEVA